MLKDKESCVNITRLLLQNGTPGSTGADVLHKDNYRQTPLFYIARDGKLDLMEMFIEKGANLNETDEYNQTPIFYACREGQTEIVKFMHERGVNIHHLDRNSENCLFYSAREGRADICKFLIEKGINVNQVDNNNQTAMSFARKKGHQMIIDLLASAGAVSHKNGSRVAKKESTKSIKGAAPGTQEMESKMATSQSASILNKRKKEKEKTRNPWRLVFTDKQGNSRELTVEEWEQFKKDYPVVAGFMDNPDTIPRDKLEDEGQLEGWESVALQILNLLWKFKGAYLFHKPVDPVKLGIPDYPKVITQPMDFLTIKVGRSNAEKARSKRVREHRGVDRRRRAGLLELQEVQRHAKRGGPDRHQLSGGVFQTHRLVRGPRQVHTFRQTH